VCVCIVGCVHCWLAVSDGESLRGVDGGAQSRRHARDLTSERKGGPAGVEPRAGGVWWCDDTQDRHTLGDTARTAHHTDGS
jgi:hypothetical protein